MFTSVTTEGVYKINNIENKRILDTITKEIEQFWKSNNKPFGEMAKSERIEHNKDILSSFEIINKLEKSGWKIEYNETGCNIIYDKPIEYYETRIDINK